MYLAPWHKTNCTLHLGLLDKISILNLSLKSIMSLELCLLCCEEITQTAEHRINSLRRGDEIKIDLYPNLYNRMFTFLICQLNINLGYAVYSSVKSSQIDAKLSIKIETIELREMFSSSLETVIDGYNS